MWVGEGIGCRQAGKFASWRGWFMVHFSCDLCGKELCDAEDRFVVKIEVFGAGEPAEISEADLDADNLEAVAQKLQESEEDADCRPVEPATRNYRFDLCPECCKRYERAPLARDAAQKFDFSEN
jgi:hypothetical protein